MRISLDLLRRRAEHNEGVLETLEEITLHQFDIERIELLHFCPNLRILYLQNNQIRRIENLRHTHLVYLNLALNNITVIDERAKRSLESCECLKKLDLTINFIADFSSISNLRGCYSLTELHLSGNPVSSEPNYREFTIQTLHLLCLDGQKVYPSQKILASDVVVTDSTCTFPETQVKKEDLEKIDAMTVEEIQFEFQNSKTSHDPHSRILAARQMAKLHPEPQKPNFSNKDESKLQIIRRENIPIQCNQAKYKFVIIDEPVLRLHVQVPLTISTELINIVIEDDAVAIRVCRKTLQLRLEQIHSSASVVHRSSSTGEIVVYMLKKSESLDPNSNAYDVFRKIPKPKAIYLPEDISDVPPLI